VPAWNTQAGTIISSRHAVGAPYWTLTFFSCLFNHQVAFGEKNNINPDMAGFREYPWGVAFEQVFEELVLGGVNEVKKVRWYRKVEENLKLDHCPVEDIHYVFQQGILVAVTIVSKISTPNPGLFTFLNEQLGTPDSKNKKSAIWSLTQTIALFSSDPASGKEILIFRWRQ